MSQPIPLPTASTVDPNQSRSQLTQSSASLPTWSYWESLGYSEEQPLKTEYFIKRMWPKDKRQQVSASVNKGIAPIRQPLQIRAVKGARTNDYTVDEVLESTQECTSDEESDYEEDPEVELDERKIF